MPLQFYEFSKEPFRDQLLENFVVPAANWFLGEPSNAYLLPQASGSHWECALAIESLFELLQLDADLPGFDKKAVRDKCVQTVRWLISRAKDVDDRHCNWDGVTWDTAICCRLLLRAESELGAAWAEKDKSDLARIRESSLRWLAKTTTDWDKDVRYPAGPPDLAQALNTICLVGQSHPTLLAKIEAEIQLSPAEAMEDRIVRVLLGMEQTGTIKLADGEVEISYWVDCFNTSEVIEGLTAYLRYTPRDSEKRGLALADNVQATLYRAIRYIECTQTDATWGGVADTCGTLYGYLRVTSLDDNVEPENHIVFQALRWMCDEKQALDDGSFLHTSYVTVFFLMALIEAYKSWKLGYKSGPEVYDIALWSSPAQETIERSRRLELQIAIDDVRRHVEELEHQIRLGRRIWLSAAALFVQFVLLLWVLALVGSIGVNFAEMNVDLIDAEKFWIVLGLGITIILVSTPAAVSLFSRRNIGTGNP